MGKILKSHTETVYRSSFLNILLHFYQRAQEFEFLKFFRPKKFENEKKLKIFFAVWKFWKFDLFGYWIIEFNKEERIIISRVKTVRSHRTFLLFLIPEIFKNFLRDLFFERTDRNEMYPVRSSQHKNIWRAKRFGMVRNDANWFRSKSKEIPAERAWSLAESVTARERSLLDLGTQIRNV